MPHKLVTNKTNYRVRSYVTGKLLKKKIILKQKKVERKQWQR